MTDFLSIGDHICLYCEETEGYVYSWQTSSVHNGLSIHHGQDRKKPDSLPNPHVAVFQIGIRNRYKLNKKYRKFKESSSPSDSLDAKAALANAKVAAEAEAEDNLSEQKRQQGRKLRYGTVIQLKHIFTGKYIHVSSTETSKRDKNNMKVSLFEYNANHAQFRILPRYKVKSEGEAVQALDQIVFESIKSPGQFLHASMPHIIDSFTTGSELNLGVDMTGFSIVKNYSPTEEAKGFMRGGSVIRLFHKELEAYIVAEGLYEDEITEDVHLRIREVDQLFARSLYPSTSGITYWQVEAENSILCGDVIRWHSQVRFRHMTTRLYLCLDSDMKICLTKDANDPNTVFRLHPIVQETDEIQFESYARIEHVLSGFWLHALRDEEYKKKQMGGTNEDDSMRGLKWDGATHRKITAIGEQVYQDAYTIQEVTEEHLHSFNFVAGMVPFLLNLIQEFDVRAMESETSKGKSSPQRTGTEGMGKRETQMMNLKKTMRVCTVFNELKTFMYVQGTPAKARQKLMRNLRIIDLLVRLLKHSPQMDMDSDNLVRTFTAAYEVLQSYLTGNSRKNALYFAKYIDFFQTQFSVQGDIGLNVAQMIVELIRDNRKIVDRITKRQIDDFVDLLRKFKNYRYLDLLSVLCVCDGVTIPENQNHITENWLKHDQSGVFLTALGQNIKKEANTMYISTDVGHSWTTLQDFVCKDAPGFYLENAIYLEHQLDLFRRLCHGHNHFVIQTITVELKYLTWDEAFLCITQSHLPGGLRAKFCDLIIGLFIDTGSHFSVLNNSNMSFVYDDLDARNPTASMDVSGETVAKHVVTIFPVLRDWIRQFLADSDGMVASRVGNNMLIEQVLRLVHFLVKFGYYSNMADMRELQTPLLRLLDGTNDLPFPETDDMTIDAMRMIQRFRSHDRYEVSRESAAVVNAKHEALEVMYLILTYQFNSRLQSILGMFKQAKVGSTKRGLPSVIEPLLDDKFRPSDQNKASQREQLKMRQDINDMFNLTSFFNTEEITSVLLDLTNYKYSKMVTKSLAVMQKYFASKVDMFKRAMDAKLLVTPDSKMVHRQIFKCIPVLRRLSMSKIRDEEAKVVCEILETFTRMCHLPLDPEENHSMNQHILMNHDVLSLVFDMLSQEIDPTLTEQYRGLKTIVINCIRLMKALAKSNRVVQKRIYERMDELLRVKVVESEIAMALREAFVDNQVTCMKVQPRQIDKIISLIEEHQENVPELLSLLCGLVKVEKLDITLKRNQTLVMKFIMRSFGRVAYVFNYSCERRKQILMGSEGESHQRYLTQLVDLLSTCAEGENLFIESLCQSILPMDEILWVISNAEIDNNIKKPYIQYLHWVYMKSSTSYGETGTGYLSHDRTLWDFMQAIGREIKTVSFLSRKGSIIRKLIKTPTPKGIPIIKTDQNEVENSLIHFLLDAVLPFLGTFFSKFYSVNKIRFPNEPEIVNQLASDLLEFSRGVKSHLISPSHQKTVMTSMTTVLAASTLERSVIGRFLDEFSPSQWIVQAKDPAQQSHENYYAEELKLNANFRTFAVNCSQLCSGLNTVSAQIKYTPKWASQTEYTKVGSDEALPLSEEFQDHIRCFVAANTTKASKQIARAVKIIQQLQNSAHKTQHGEDARILQDELDIRCLQLLRAIIHNEIAKLPSNWKDGPHKFKIHLDRIREIQNTLIGMGVIEVLSLLGRPNDEIVRETLAFMCALLFNANNVTQRAMVDYFVSLREEVFFIAVVNRMHMSTIAIKERRALVAQLEARGKEVLAQKRNIESIMAQEKKRLEQGPEPPGIPKNMKVIGKTVLAGLRFKSKSRWSLSPSKRTPSVVDQLEPPQETAGQDNGSILVTDDKVLIDNNIEMQPVETVTSEEELPFEEAVSVSSTDINDTMEYKDEGYIELLLKMLALMCDGQYSVLQNYLRDQPDNMKSFNIIAETTAFLNMVYSNISPGTINLVSQLFNTLNEFCSGNQDNRAVVVAHKVTDYMNFILRAGEIEGCSQEEVCELRLAIGNLLFSLIEENGAVELLVAKEVKDTVDMGALFKVMSHCYESHRQGSDKLAPDMVELGFAYYFVLQRFYDIDPNLTDDEVNITPEQEKAFRYYKKNSMSIEIVKNDILQKVNFRVVNKSVLREEVKEKLKWSVDRSSPSSKIQGLMEWSKNILKDIHYQKRILSHWLAAFIAKRWVWWNTIAIVLSLLINVVMLATWKASLALGQFDPANRTELPEELFDPKPQLDNPLLYYTLVDILGGLHNLVSFLVLLSYFMSNHPQFPDVIGWFRWLRLKLAKRGQTDKDDDYDDDDDEKDLASNLDVRFLSVKTIFFVFFFALSMAGSFVNDLFFAFHLLNIVNNNQLLAGVIQAVTQNGKSLLWVGILGLVIFYLYAIVAFALFRDVFDPEEYLFCESLWQCTVTVVRYGLVGDYDNYQRHTLKSSFTDFGYLSIFQISFFICITTIGLNIIFGIIVDTFSELRDLKWTAESDMRDTCFICSRGSYDFERNAKGFNQHVKQEHCMWAYIFYLIHLDDTKSNDYTAIDLYVSNLLGEERYDFFPLNRALSLRSMDEDSTESKIDDLLDHVMTLVQKQKEEEAARKRQEERMHQRRWEETHRQQQRASQRVEGSNDLGSTHV